ncbi:MAG: adenosine kinase [Verrucomicrobia bacterium]|nr:adenosine kinase [Verrucomicrobiota bacterium]
MLRALIGIFILPIFPLLHCYEVLTISDAIVDYILHVDEEFLNAVPGKKGGCDLIDHSGFQFLIEQSAQLPLTRPGGSAVNMIKGLQKLGHSCALITTIGEDEAGEFFLSRLNEDGIHLFLANTTTPTGTSACLVSPSGERTMRTFLGASRENGALELNSCQFEGISHFHLEGYQLQHEKLCKEALHFARETNATISLDLSSFEVVRAHKERIWELLEQGYIDILFCNQEEAEMLTNLCPEEASEQLATYCDISVITSGEKGSCVRSHEGFILCPALNVSVVDTIGAGDLFISGFLHGFLMDKSLKECAEMGTLLASHVVQAVGAEIPEDQWTAIISR